MTVLSSDVEPAALARKHQVRTPAPLYRLFGQPLLRAALGWDLAGRDLRRAGVAQADGSGLWLEIGSGGGFYTGALQRHLGPGGRLIALDPDHGSLRRLGARGPRLPVPALAPLTGDGLHLPLRAESVSLVLFGYSLEEIPDPLSAIAEVRRVLQPGGVLVAFIWRPVLRGTRRERVLRALDGTLEPVVRRCGPQNIRLTYRR